ncbi:MAG TPA: chorismate synthase, partial [Clostridiales bacterium]|nr:chorismate synthase [Clostridiales bacterium]
MSSCYGKNIQISIFGQCHSPAIGVVIDGLPAGFAPDMEKLSAFLERRAPGRNALSTPRQETDKVEIVSGMADGRFCGAPFAALIYNHNVHSSDYHNIKETPRPGHADFSAFVKYHG